MWKRQLRVSDVARILKCDISSFSRFKNGYGKLPLKHHKAFCELLDLSSHDLLNGVIKVNQA